MRSITNSKVLLIIALLLISRAGKIEAWSQDTGMFKVKGYVYDAGTSVPLQDIGVSAVYSSVETVRTDSLGYFEIELPDKNEQLLLSYPGFRDKKIFLHGKREINVSMLKENDISISEDVNTTFREQSLRDIAGAVEKSRLINFDQSPSASFEQDLQGRMSGLMVINRSGMPGEGAYMTCRGYASLFSASAPLIIIDGMIQRTESFNNPVINGYFQNPLADIDKRDISNIVLLKDAAANGTYGIKAANGVMLITTTPPRGGKTTLDVSLSGGIATAPPRIPVLDAEHYSSYVMEQMYDAGLNSAEIFSEFPFLEFNPDYLHQSRYNNNTNWQDEIFRTGNLYDAHLTVRGGDARATYALSGGFLSNEAIIKNSAYNRFNFRFNSIVKVSPKLDIGFNLGYTAGKYNLMETGSLAQTNPLYSSLIKSPMLTVFQKDTEGMSLPVYDDVADFNVSNPAVIVNEVEASNGTSKFMGVSYVNVNLSDRLSIRAQLGLDRLKSNERIFIPSWGMAPQGDGSAERSMKVKVNQYYSLLGEARISYQNNFSYVHDFSLDAGARYMINRINQDAGSAQNSATDEFKDLNSGKTDEKSVDGFEDRWSWLNYFISAGYILNDRYILRANLSLDASSRFGKTVEEGISAGGYPFAVLPSAGLAWRISSESFMKGLDFLDELKLRISYGRTGNDDFPSYYTRLYYITIPYYSVTGFTLNGLYNPNLKWEELSTLNAGIDLALFHERLILSGNRYKSMTEDMIIHNMLPEYYGYTGHIDNSGAVESVGTEFSMYGKILDGSFRWEIDMNFTQVENEVSSLDDDQIIISFTGGEKIIKTGKAMGLFYGYHSLGVIGSQQEADNIDLVDKSGRRFNAGDIYFEDLDDNGVIDERDKTIIGNPYPDFTAGFYNSFHYKGFTFSFLLYYARGMDVFNYMRSKMEAMENFNNQSAAIYKRWVKGGETTNIPKAAFGDPMGNNRFSSRWIEDGSFFRLKSVTLSYTFPENTGFLKSLNIYVTANNLFTISEYLGYDPEFSFMNGILGQGIDYGKFPQPRSMIAGLKIGL